MSVSNEILKEPLILTPTEKAKLIDRLLFSLDNPDKELDNLWSKEAIEFLEDVPYFSLLGITE